MHMDEERAYAMKPESISHDSFLRRRRIKRKIRMSKSHKSERR
jgi:hypothetical protein